MDNIKNLSAYSSLVIGNQRIEWNTQIWTISDKLVINSFLAKFETYDLGLVYFINASDALQYISEC